MMHTMAWNIQKAHVAPSSSSSGVGGGGAGEPGGDLQRGGMDAVGHHAGGQFVASPSVDHERRPPAQTVTLGATAEVGAGHSHVSPQSV